MTLTDLTLLKDEFDSDGFVVLRNYLNAEELTEMHDHIDHYLTPPSGISLWIAMDYIDSRNGCLHYEKGSHLRNLPSTYPLRDYDEHNVNVVPIVARPGDAVMHSTRVIHFSIDVIEERPRNAMVFAYWGGSSRIDPALVARSRSAYTEHRVIL